MEAGCHFGHQTTRWNPKMKPFIYSARDRIHIFDLVQTKTCLEEAGKYLAEVVKENKQIVFVGTKRQSQDLVVEIAKKLNLPYVTERWIGGLITNWSEVSQRIKKMIDWTNLRETNGFTDRTKRELVLIDREIAKLKRHFDGVSTLTNVPAAIIVTDAHKNVSALLEAKRAGVKVVAIADTNANPDLIDYPIPANDDAVKSVELILNYLADAIIEGRAQVAKPQKVLKVENETIEKVPKESEKVVDKKVKSQKTQKLVAQKAQKIVKEVQKKGVK